MEYDAIIIGAGVGGLTSALRLIKAGKKVLVIERQLVPGGVGTNFTRKGFTFEAVLHIITTLGLGGEVRRYLDELGVSPRVEFIDFKEFGRIVYPEHDFVAQAEFESLKSYLKEKFPHEAKGLELFFRQEEKFYRELDSFSEARLPLWLKLSLSPLLYPLIVKTSCLTFEQFISQQIKDKKLRAILSTVWGFVGLPPSELSAFYYLMVFRGCLGEKTSFVRGGFSSLFKAMAAKIKDSGSEIKFSTTVTRIITDKGKVIRGVITEKGEEFMAKAVISNANAIDTLTRMVDEDSVKEFYSKKLSGLRKSVSGLTVYLGLDCPAKSVGINYPLFSLNSTYDHDESFRLSSSGDYSTCNLALIDHSQLDPGLAPRGKSAVVLMSLDSYCLWQGLGKEEYQERKKQVIDIMLKRLEKYFPGITGHVEFAEVGTPLTMERFPKLPEGAIYGFAQTVGQSSANRLSQETRVKGLFLVGAWTKPGCGVHACFISGEDVTDLALRYLRNK